MKRKILAGLILVMMLCALTGLSAQAEWSPEVSFSTVDQYGITRTESIFQNARLTMLNLWACWDDACVKELPTLQLLAANYAGDLQIYGVSLADYEEDNVQTMNDMGVYLPLLQLTDSLNGLLNTGYIPAAVFVDSNGHIVSDVQVCSRSYDEWSTIVSDLLANME